MGEVETEMPAGAAGKHSDARSRRFRDWLDAKKAPRIPHRRLSPTTLAGGVARFCTGGRREDLAVPDEFSNQETERIWNKAPPGRIDIRKNGLIPQVEQWIRDQEAIAATSETRQVRTLVLREVWLLADGIEGVKVIVNYDSHNVDLKPSMQWRCQDFLLLLNDGSIVHEGGAWDDPKPSVGTSVGKAGVVMERSKSGWAGVLDPGVVQRHAVNADPFPANPRPKHSNVDWKIIYENKEPLYMQHIIPADLVGNATRGQTMMWVEHMDSWGHSHNELTWRLSKPFPGTALRRGLCSHC